MATTCSSTIKLAIWSPCNKFIAITQDGTSAIHILDSMTLQQLQILRPPQGTYTQHGVLIFSPDSQMLTYSGPNHLDQELFVISWDLQTGGIAGINKWQVSVQDIIVAPSITYSTDGKMVGVFCQPLDGAARIFICTVASGIYTTSHSVDTGVQLPGNIWTSGGSLRFATADRITITIWEIGFAPGAAPVKVKTLPAPSSLIDCKRTGVQLLPSLYWLAIAYSDKVLVWDAWNSRCLLQHTDTGFGSKMSFSPNGHFFACKTSRSEVYLWRQSSNGYILYKVFFSGSVYSTPVFSQNGGSIAMFGGHTIQLWRTKSFTSPSSSSLTRVPQGTGNFVLDFSPDGMLAAVAMQKDDLVTVIGLKSGAPQLTIDVGMEVYGLRVIRDSIVIMGDCKVVAWNLPAGNCVPDSRVGPKDSSWTINLSSQQDCSGVIHVSVSPDCDHNVFITEDPTNSQCVSHTSTGELLSDHLLVKTEAMSWFTKGGQNIWHTKDQYSADTCRVDGPDTLGSQVHIAGFEHPLAKYPQRSCGYQVTDDWWVCDLDGKRLLMLPPPWASDLVHCMWKGQYLVLLHCGLSEPVILDLNP